VIKVINNKKEGASMILQCPACNTQYRLKQNNISDEGRRVKCVKCQHSWVAMQGDLIEDAQQIVLDEKIAIGAHGSSRSVVKESINIKAIQKNEDKVSDVNFSSTETNVESQAVSSQVIQDNDVFLRSKPTIVRPREAVPRFTVAPDKSRKRIWPILLIIILVLGVLITSLLLMRKSIVKTWEGSARLYDMLGLHVPIIGEGLKFENLKTSFDRNPEGGKFMILEGEIKNISNDEKIIPSIKVVPYKREDKVLTSAKIKVNVEKIKPGESANFKTQLPQDTRLNARDELRFYED
jgi:predicted Zn finger-like uncharacterized protein